MFQANKFVLQKMYSDSRKRSSDDLIDNSDESKKPKESRSEYLLIIFEKNCLGKLK